MSKNNNPHSRTNSFNHGKFANSRNCGSEQRKFTEREKYYKYYNRFDPKKIISDLKMPDDAVAFFISEMGFRYDAVRIDFEYSEARQKIVVLNEWKTYDTDIWSVDAMLEDFAKTNGIPYRFAVSRKMAS